MKKILSLLVFTLLLKNIIVAQGTWTAAGCGGAQPTVEKVLIDACGDEGYTEFFIFKTGTSSYDPSNLSSSSSSGAAGTPFTASGYSGANAAAAGIVNQLNSWAGCVAFVAAPNPIPANSNVIAFNSSNGISSITPQPNLASWCGQTIYVVSGNYTMGTTGFYNNNQSNNPLTIDFGACATIITYPTGSGFPTGAGTNITQGSGTTANYNAGGATGCFPPPPVNSCTPPTPPNYPCSGWNVAVYEDGPNFNLTNFKGFYTSPNDPVASSPPAPIQIGSGSFGFSTLNDGYPLTGSPSSATGYNGCPVGNDGFTIWAKKTCFPCAYYKIFAKSYDDQLIVKVDVNGDGTPEFTSPQYTFGAITNQVVWEGFLNNNSKVDLQIMDFIPNGLDFKAEIDFLVQNITLNPTNSGPICAGQSVNLNSTVSPTGLNPTPALAFSWTGPSGFTANTQNTTHNPSPGGTYTVSVTTPAGCTPISATTNVALNSVSFTPIPDVTVCGNFPTLLLVTGVPPPSGTATYLWSGPGLNSTTSPTPTATPTAPVSPATSSNNNYSVTVTQNGCQWVDNFAITSFLVPTAPNLQTPISACPGQQIALTVNSINTGAPFPLPATTTILLFPVTYTWTGPNGGTVVNSGTYGPGTLPYSVTVTAPSTPGTYTYSLTGALTIAPTCASSPANVTVNVQNGTAATLNTGQVCQGGTLPLTPLITTIPTPVGTWSGANVLGTNFLATTLTAGTYTVTFTPTGACGTPVTTTITVNAGPISSQSQTGIICGGPPYSGTVTLNVDNNAAWTYNWSAGVTGSGNSVTVTQPNNYTVTVTNTATTCSVVKTFNVLATPLPTPTINGVNQLCDGGNTTLSVSPTGFSTYNWAIGANPSLGTGSSLNIVGTNTQTIYSVTVTNAQGCSAVVTKTIDPSPALSITYTGTPVICGTTPAVLTITGAYSIYQWTSNISNTATATITTPAIYTVTVTDASGCKGTLAIDVKQVNVTPVTIAGVTQICSSQATTSLTASAGFILYNWNYLNQTGATINVPAGGTYTVTATDNNGCKVTDSKNVSNFPATTPIINGNATVCQNATTPLTVTGGTFTAYQWSPNTVSGGTPTVGAGTYNLTVTDNNNCKGSTSKIIATDVVSNSITGNLNICAGGATTTLSSTNPFNQYAWSNSTSANSITVGGGTYTLTVTNGNGCTNISTATVNNLPVPTGTISGNSEYCAGTTLTLATNTTFSSYQWSGGGNTGTSPSFVANGTGTYSVTVTDANNCTAVFTKNITQNPIPTPAISGSTSICPGASTTLDATTPNATYLWSNATASTTPSITTNMVGNYTVTVTDNKGCKGEKTVTVKQNASLSITIAGTPNFCPGKSTTLNAGAGFSNYKWSSNANDATTQTVTVLSAGAYFVTVSNGTCSGTASIVVAQNPKPAVTIVGDSSICKGATGTLITDKSFSSYAWSNNGLNQSTTYTNGTIYSVTVTDALGCTNSDNITVKINDLPTPNIIGNTQICVGDSTKLETDKTYSIYSWSNNSTNPSIFANQFTTYSVSVTDINGCQGKAATNISQVAALKPTITGKKDLCEGETIDLTASAGFGKYQWSNNEKTAKITVSSGGTYIVTVSNGACTGVDSIKVTLNKKPVLVMSNDTSACEGNQITLKANAGSAVYEWSTNEKTPFIQVDKTGDYKVTVTNLEGCFVMGSVKITINPAPKPLISAPNTICVGEKAVFALTEKYDKYLWSNGKTTDTIQVNDTNIYSVTVTTTDGCTAATSKSVAIKNNLSPIILGKIKFCDGENTVLSLDAAYNTYSWSSGEKTATITLNDNAKVTVTVTSASGCQGTTTIDVTKLDNPKPNIAGLLSVCSGKATVLNAGNFASYLWNDNTTNQTLSVDKAGDYSVTVTDIEGCKGNNFVKVTENQAIGSLTDTLCKNDFKTINGKKYDINNAAGQEVIVKGSIGGCDSTVNIQLYFRNEISVQLESLGAVCSGKSATIKINVTGTSSSFSMVYEDEKGNKNTINNIKDGDTFSVNPTETTTYTIKSISVGSTQCTPKLGSVRVDVSKVNLKLKVVDYFGFGVSCNGKSDGSISANASNGVTPYQFIWSNGQTEQALNNLKSGTYKVTVTDGASCKSIDSVYLKEPTPIVTVIKGINPACASSPKGSIVINDIQGGSGVYLYSLDGLKFSNVGVKPFKINGLDAGDFKVTIKDLNECSVEENIKIDKGSFIKVDLGLDVTIEYGDSVVLTPTADFQMKNISWTNAKYLSCDTCQFPLAKPKVTTGFKITVFNESGCSTTDDILIFVLNPRNVFVPSAFSPNSDGTNDFLKVFLGTNVVKVNFFRVYDRWGNIVYEDLNFTRDQSNEATRGWDGSFRGQSMNPAVFTYGLEVEYNDGEKRMYKGDFSLINKD